MLRLLAWRLSFEIFEWLKRLGFKGKSVFYFAFGGNLDPQVLKLRNVSPHSVKPFVLQNFELVFDQQGPFEGFGFASIRESPGQSVYGKVYEISRVDALRMHCFEASLFIRKYKRKSVNIPDVSSIYFYQTRLPRVGLRPTADYHAAILRGYDTPLAKDFAEALRKWPIVESLRPSAHINFVIDDYTVFGRSVSRLLRVYDSWCLRVFIYLLHKPGFLSRRA